jgi:RNA polymerase sigma factor (TIGR02999 family)
MTVLGLPAAHGARQGIASAAMSADDAAPPSPSAPSSVQVLFPQLYRELRRLARSRLAAGGRNTLMDTSTLVHEAYLRMQQGGGAPVQGREHFLAYAATTMRSVVIDTVRRRQAQRRGGDAEHVRLDTQTADQIGDPSSGSDEEILRVHEALQTLAQVDARLVRVVEMRYFAGLTDAEVASALGVADRTVRRDWERARLLLADMLGR